MIEDETPLPGGNVTAVVRVGDTVRRATGPWSTAVHDLLRHLEAVGFAGAPRFRGLDAQGREILTFLPGEVGRYPLPRYMWADAALVGAARLLRRYHDATVGYVPPADARWQMADPDPARHEVICHNDFAPYNLTFVDEQPVGIIDFDWAGPGPRRWDLAYAAYRFVPVSYADDVTALGLADLATQAARLRRFCAAYGERDPLALLPWIEARIARMADIIRTQAAAGHAAFQRQLAEGHLAHYERELAAFRLHRPALTHALRTMPAEMVS
jgi:hypothetical protein